MAHDNHAEWRLFVSVQRIQDDLSEMIQPSERVASEVDANHAAAPTREGAKVAKCLSLLEYAERVRLAGYWKVDLVIRAELNENSGVWSPFVKLTSRVKKPWTVAGGGSALRTIAYSRSQFLQGAIDLGSLFDVVQKGDIVVVFDCGHL